MNMHDLYWGYFLEIFHICHSLYCIKKENEFIEVKLVAVDKYIFVAVGRGMHRRYCVRLVLDTNPRGCVGECVCLY